jgi:hypothetical protein
MKSCNRKNPAAGSFSGRNYLDVNLILIFSMIIIGSCSSDRPRVGDWYEAQHEKKPNIRISCLGTGNEITADVKGRGYRYISGAGEYAEESCFAYEDSQQVLWEKIHFLVIEPVSNLRTRYRKAQDDPRMSKTGNR